MPLIGSTDPVSGAAAGSQSAASQAALEEDLNRFLNLLVTQLKNQDPLDPLDANEFTSQLVQFASVEQQIFQNSNLEKLLKLQETNQVSFLVSYLGTTVEAEGKKLPLENGNAEFTYTIPAGANKATITITNSTGNTVFKTDADITSGKHAFVWDGRDSFGIQQPDGAYNVLVSGTDTQGGLLTVPQTIFGRVTGAGAENGQVTLFLGDDIEVPQDDVLTVKESPTAELGG